MARCPVCGDDKAQGTTIFSVDLGDGVVVIRSVPAQACDQCGEEWIDDQTAKDIEDMVDQAKKRRHQVEVLTFPSGRE